MNQAIREIAEDNSGVRDGVRNRQYSALLLDIDKEELTPIEALQQQLVKTYILFDEEFFANGYKTEDGYKNNETRELPYHIISNFLLRLIEKGIDKEKFFSTLAMKQKYMVGMDIKLGFGVFSYRKTQSLNAKMGYNSKLSLKHLDKMKVELY